jgi:hypothetical protein
MVLMALLALREHRALLVLREHRVLMVQTGLQVTER